ncbi:hypothetical protein DM819_21630 [Pseudomonas hunanensis]|uniref:Uncharacterized protein n=1 Tax=Pseudomonas hunanensis TaxID=1247546 RepID=A0ABD6N579_9PSED|nr:hypothetical protein [Pseudomonas hunanensis]NWL48394.1 hypothetical protein [Pseudomonas hunanensis]
MSIYESLKAKYTDGWKLELQYWDDLERLAQRSRKDFADFVGVDSGDTVIVGGEELLVVELGSYLDNKFEPCRVSELPRKNRELEVAFRLNFQIDVNPPKKVQHVFTFELTKENGSFQAIDRVDFESKRFLVPEFTNFFKHLTQSL